MEKNFCCLGSSNGPRHPVELSEDGEILTSMSSGLSWKSENKNRKIHKGNLIKNYLQQILCLSKFLFSILGELFFCETVQLVRESHAWSAGPLGAVEEPEIFQQSLSKFWKSLSFVESKLGLAVSARVEAVSQMKPPKTIHL